MNASPARRGGWQPDARHDWYSVRRALNYYLCKLEMKLGRTRVRSLPFELCVDVSNKCNLQCPYCPTGRGESGRPRGNVSYELFCRILDELGPYAYKLELFNWGEAFFNPELPRLVAYAAGKRVRTLISSNLSFRLKEEDVRALIAGGLSYLTASVDGSEQQSYEAYRRGGKFGLVMDNLRLFVRLRRELGADYPKIYWRYLVFAHNEGKVGEARALAQELGLDDFVAEAGLHEDPSWAPQGSYQLDYLDIHPNRCVWLWNKAVFHWDGGLASCCQGFHQHDDFAQFRPGQFRRLWNNDKFVAARRIWTEPESPLPPGHFCTRCEKVRVFRQLSRAPAAPALPPAEGVVVDS
ncbi:MAG: radical SAM protein [Deltaproteobacteria bacterium]|nr:radical SAM protein [Deltaproteobacteria bacterium]